MAREPLLLGKLGRIRDEVLREQEREWKGLVDAVGDTLLDTLRDDRDADLGTIDELDACAKLLDCCECLARDALGTGSEAIENEVVSRDLVDPGSLRAFIDDVLTDAPKRGYIYVAWSARPEAYGYVGQAKREDRVRKIGHHGRLMAALHDASLFTVIFPPKETRLEDLESAILRLLKHRDQPPAHNGSQLPAAPHGERRARLQHMSKSFARFAKRLA